MRLNPILRALPLLVIAAQAAAQSTPAQRVEITGSSIKRIQLEGALPIQTITAAEIARAGITTAEQLVSMLSANSSGVDNMVSNQGGDFLNSLIFTGRSANNGSSAVALRGLGPQNTLVLLNGRRVSSHGLNGSSVDLNSIPLAALDRVEILKDGASAIYGTDAIGGVMNFILKRDYRGFEISGLADATQAGGGNVFRGNALFGAGSLDSQGFNVMASLSVEKQERLRGSQRDFHNGYQPARGLAPDTTGTPFATINAAAGTALPRAFVLPGSTQSYNRVNLLSLEGKCDSIPNTYPYRGDITGSNNNNKACAYDYGKDWSLQQPVERVNLVARGMFKLGSEHTGTVELTGSRVNSSNEYTHNQITAVARGANYPAFIKDANGVDVRSPYYLDLTGQVPGFDNTKAIRLRWRCLDCGTRQQETETETFRALLGLEGMLAGWDYRLGLSSSGSKASTNYLNGYLKEATFKAAMDTGLINPFLRPGQTQTAQALALIEGAQFRGKLYGGEANLTQLDAVVSREIATLPAGPLHAAIGIDVRRETYQFNDGTIGREAIIGAGSPASLNQASREIKAVFAELQVPIVKNLDAQLAVRHDRYSDFGDTTNPKVALRWQPMKQLVLRGSYNTGFHAPDFGPLHEGENTGQFNSDVNDPVNCPLFPGDIRYCGIRPATKSGGNPTLKPERSTQQSLGIVFAPFDGFSGSLDLFAIEVKDRISSRTPQEVLALYQTLGQYIVRLPNGQIDYVRGGWINVAGDRVRGIDLNLNVDTKTSFGRITANLDGTYLDKYQVRKDAGSPWVDRVGEFGDSSYLWDLKLRWKHTASVTWSDGNWSSTLTQIYKSGYKSEVDGYGSDVILQDLGYPSRINSYTLYNASVTYTGIKNLTLTGGIKNLFDKDPPFSNHNVDNVAGAGWDARVGVPRGRAFTLRAGYKFW